MKNIFIFVFVFSYFNISAQNVYKTPSGKRYHLTSCRMVENVSKKLIGTSEIAYYKLTPCRICKPPIINSLDNVNSISNKAVGEAETVQCIGITQKGFRCKHKTSLANGYCYQHTKQNIPSQTNSPKVSSINISICGAETISGGYCKRKVKSGGYCYQHRS